MARTATPGPATSEELNRAYAKGYSAGRRRGAAEAATVSSADQFWRSAMLAALPFAMQQDGWQRRVGETKTAINALDDRILLASEVADHALTIARNLGRV